MPPPSLYILTGLDPGPDPKAISYPFSLDLSDSFTFEERSIASEITPLETHTSVLMRVCECVCELDGDLFRMNFSGTGQGRTGAERRDREDA